MSEPVTMKDYLDMFEKRKRDIEAHVPMGWVVGWEYGLFVKFKDGDCQTTGYENCTEFVLKKYADAKPVWNGGDVKALVMMSETAKRIALTEIERAINTCREHLEKSNG